VSTHDRAFAPLSQALEKGVVVQFRYLRPGGAEAAQRTIAPLALYQFRGRWYLTGTSAADGGERTYLLSRIVGPVTLTKQPAPRAPADAAQRYLRELEGIWLANEAVVDVVPGSDAAVRLGHRYGTAEGATRLEPHYADVHVLADELAGYGPEALVVEPAALRDAVLERLRRARALHENVLDQGRPPVGGPAPHGGAPDRHAVRGTTPDRLTLLLSLLPYLMATKVVSVAEVAEHFDLDVDEVRRAVELIAVSGIPGSTRAYDPGDLFDIDWEAFEDEDVIVLTHGVAIDDSPRLSAREAAVLITGLQLLQALPENDPAAIDALKAKLARGATEAPAPVAIAAVESDETLATIAAIRRAIAERTQLAFDYLDGEGNREHLSVDPLRLESSDDTWYLRAWCHLREGIRTFRLDRISGLAATGEPIGESAVEASLPDSLFEASPDDLTVELRIAEAALPFVADYLGAVPATPDGDGWLRADIRVAHFHGLKRIATGNAGLIEVLSPPAARDEVVAWADAAIRAYEAPHRPGGG
jgi:proteasome accessory factor C